MSPGIPILADNLLAKTLINSKTETANNTVSNKTHSTKNNINAMRGIHAGFHGFQKSSGDGQTRTYILHILSKVCTCV